MSCFGEAPCFKAVTPSMFHLVSGHTLIARQSLKAGEGAPGLESPGWTLSQEPVAALLASPW